MFIIQKPKLKKIIFCQKNNYKSCCCKNCRSPKPIQKLNIHGMLVLESYKVQLKSYLVVVQFQGHIHCIARSIKKFSSICFHHLFNKFKNDFKIVFIQLACSKKLKFKQQKYSIV